MEFIPEMFTWFSIRKDIYIFTRYTRSKEKNHDYFQRYKKPVIFINIININVHIIHIYIHMWRATEMKIMIIIDDFRIKSM